jgi:hypothetical protein
MVLCSFFNCCFDWHTCCIPVNTSLISTHNPRNCSICTSLYELLIKLYTQALVARTTPLFTNFLFTNLFSIKKNYFFIISSLFPYFNLFVSIFIQSYVNNNFHVSTLSIYIAMQIVRSYEYWHEQVKIRKKRWNNKEIKKFYWK